MFIYLDCVAHLKFLRDNYIAKRNIITNIITTCGLTRLISGSEMFTVWYTRTYLYINVYLTLKLLYYVPHVWNRSLKTIFRHGIDIFLMILVYSFTRPFKLITENRCVFKYFVIIVFNIAHINEYNIISLCDVFNKILNKFYTHLS